MPEIIHFAGERHPLSNAYPLDVEGVDHTIYRTAEHAYQAAKFDDPAMRERIRLAPWRRAKQLGKGHPGQRARKDWQTRRKLVMGCLLLSKFDRHPFVQQYLQETSDAILLHTNWWGDRYWGVCGGTGENVLGALWMDIRQLQHERHV